MAHTRQLLCSVVHVHMTDACVMLIASICNKETALYCIRVTIPYVTDISENPAYRYQELRNDQDHSSTSVTIIQGSHSDYPRYASTSRSARLHLNSRSNNIKTQIERNRCIWITNYRIIIYTLDYVSILILSLLVNPIP